MAKVLKVRNADNTGWDEIASSIPDISTYLTINSASSTYATKSELDNVSVDLTGYLTESSASTTYATKTELENIDLSSASAAAVTYLVDGAPNALNTLNELSAALNDDENFATTVTNSLSEKLSIQNASTTYLTQYSASTTYATKINPQITGTSSIQEILEYATILSSAITKNGLYQYDVLDNHAVAYVTAESAGDFGLNIRGSSSTALNSIMNVGQSLTIVLLITNGSLTGFPNEISIDGSFTNNTKKWLGGITPSNGNQNSIDAYSFTIIKTSNNVFTVLASQNKFA